jgi:hypothetical protein
MALFRCNKCGHIREVGNDYIGKSVKCPKCTESTSIYDTVAFIKALLQKHISQNKQLKELRQGNEEELNTQIVESNNAAEIDIYNTTALTQSNHYEPIVKWFEKNQIQIEIDLEANDTTGFFDEIALLIGNNFNTLKFVSDQIKYIQNKGYSNVKLDLSKKNDKEIKEIKSFCNQMYDYSFVARYNYEKKENIIRLTVQAAPRIRNFFNGKWMEWFTFMKLLEFFRDKNLTANCMRSLNVSFQNGDSNELDIFFLTKNNIPVCIECKSGEFRKDIDKYLKLRKKLQLDKSQFIVCVFGLSNEQTQGMSSMYDITFTNETNLINHIEKII